MWVVGPVLRAFAPGVVLIVFVGPFGHALVFDIEEDEVDADGGALGRHDASHLHEGGNATGAVVGAEDGFAVVACIGVVVGPETAVPVGAKHDTVAIVGVEGGDDVHTFDGLTVPEGGGEGLCDDGVAPLRHLGLQIGGALLLSLAARGAEAEGELSLDERIGRVGREVGSCDRGIVNYLSRGDGLLVVVAGCRQNKQRRYESASDY